MCQVNPAKPPSSKFQAQAAIRCLSAGRRRCQVSACVPRHAVTMGPPCLFHPPPSHHINFSFFSSLFKDSTPQLSVESVPKNSHFQAYTTNEYVRRLKEKTAAKPNLFPPPGPRTGPENHTMYLFVLWYMPQIMYISCPCSY